MYSPNALISVDHLPWEVHEIEDDSAYEIALTAYSAAILC